MKLLRFLELQFLSDFRDIFFSHYSLTISMFNWRSQSLPFFSAFSALVCSLVSRSLHHDVFSRTQQRRKLKRNGKEIWFFRWRTTLKMQCLLLFPNVMAGHAWGKIIYPFPIHVRAVQLHAWIGHWGSRRLRIPELLDSQRMKVVRL
jgi:hypothetical protein